MGVKKSRRSRGREQSNWRKRLAENRPFDEEKKGDRRKRWPFGGGEWGIGCTKGKPETTRQGKQDVSEIQKEKNWAEIHRGNISEGGAAVH